VGSLANLSNPPALPIILAAIVLPTIADRFGAIISILLSTNSNICKITTVSNLVPFSELHPRKELNGRLPEPSSIHLQLEVLQN